MTHSYVTWLILTKPHRRAIMTQSPRRCAVCWCCALQCVAMCCSVLQRVPVCSSVLALFTQSPFCSPFFRAGAAHQHKFLQCGSVLQCVAVCLLSLLSLPSTLPSSAQALRTNTNSSKQKQHAAAAASCPRSCCPLRAREVEPPRAALAEAAAGKQAVRLLPQHRDARPRTLHTLCCSRMVRWLRHGRLLRC